MTTVTCPQCGGRFEVDFTAGTEFTCGSCQAVVTVPDAPEEAMAPHLARGRRPLPAVQRHVPAREHRGAFTSRTLLLWMGGGLLLLLVLALVFVMDNSKKKETGPGAPGQEPPSGNRTAHAAQPKASLDPYMRARQEAETSLALPDLLRFGDLAWQRAKDAQSRRAELRSKHYRRDARWAYARVLDLAPNHPLARERSGFVRLDPKELARYQKLSYLPRSLRDDIEFTLEDFKDRKRYKGRATWLSADKGLGREWALMSKKIKRLMALEEAKKTDPWYPKARRLAESLVRQFSGQVGHANFLERGLHGSAFKTFLRKPYLLLIQRARSGEAADKVAERWGDVLEALQKSFHGKYAAGTNLKPELGPVQVFVLRDAQEYAKYLRIGDAAKQIYSGGHFEPWNNRLVCFLQASPELEEGTLFHEGTHQIVNWGMKRAATYPAALGKQALWFSEGIADYFGGHGKHYDQENLSYIYTPGLINQERIATLKTARDTHFLFSLRKLLKYSRDLYTLDRNNPQKRRKTGTAYAQGWALVYLLNNAESGKYVQDFVKYMKLEFAGQSGTQAFLQTFGRYGLDRIEKEYLAMIDQLIEAMDEKRIVNGRILPH